MWVERRGGKCEWFWWSSEECVEPIRRQEMKNAVNTLKNEKMIGCGR